MFSFVYSTTDNTNFSATTQSIKMAGFGLDHCGFISRRSSVSVTLQSSSSVGIGVHHILHHSLQERVEQYRQFPMDRQDDMKQSTYCKMSFHVTAVRVVYLHITWMCTNYVTHRLVIKSSQTLSHSSHKPLHLSYSLYLLDASLIVNCFFTYAINIESYEILHLLHTIWFQKNVTSCLVLCECVPTTLFLFSYNIWY